MQAEIIPLIVVKDVSANVKYLETVFGFEIRHQAFAGEFVAMEYHGATFELQSSRLYECGCKKTPEGSDRGKNIEIQLRIQGVRGVYTEAVHNGAIIISHLNSMEETRKLAILRFSAALPDGHVITFFESTRAAF